MPVDSRFDAVLENDLDRLPLPAENDWIPHKSRSSSGAGAGWVIGVTAVIVAAVIAGQALGEWRQLRSQAGSSGAAQSSAPTSAGAGRASGPPYIIEVRPLQPDESFVPMAEPADLAISRVHALSLAQVGLTGTLTSATAEYGHLYSPRLGIRSDSQVWFVTLDGLASPAQPGGPLPGGPRRTFVFIDARDGSTLISVHEGVGPPLTP